MRVVLVGLLALPLVGCLQDPAPYAPLEGGAPRGALIGESNTNIFGDEVPADAEELWLADPELFGNVGDVDVYGGGRIHDGYVLTDYAYVELRSAGTAGALMNAYAISGLDRLEPGSYTFSVDEPVDRGVQISSFACSGVREDMWTYDRPAEQMDVQVDSGANANELRVEIVSELASYTTERSNITARFTIVRPEAPAAP